MSDYHVAPTPVREVTSERLEQQASRAQAAGNWVFLLGSAEPLAHSPTRKMELGREYVGRHRTRTWQGLGGAPARVVATAKPWRLCDAQRARIAGSPS
jgi:hypothetical protein